MAQDLSNFNGALKDDYGPGMRSAINNHTPVISEAVERNVEQTYGRKFVWSTHATRSSSNGARPEGAALPTPGYQLPVQPSDDLAYNYATIQLTGQVKHQSASNVGAFVDALDFEIKGAENDLKNSYARQAYGQIATVNAASVTGVIATLTADPGTGTTITCANDDPSIFRYFYQNMNIAFIDPATGNKRSGGPGANGAYVVVSASQSARTITISTAADSGIATGDFIVQASSDGATNLGNEINGLRYLISNATYATINPATTPSWAALSAGSTSTDVSEVLFNEASELPETDGNGTTPNLALVEYAQRRKLAAVLAAQKRYDGMLTKLKGSWDGLQLERLTLVADRYCPTSYGFVLNTDDLVHFVNLNWSWDDDAGSILQFVPGYDAIRAQFKAYTQLGVTNRNSHVAVRMALPNF